MLSDNLHLLVDSVDWNHDGVLRIRGKLLRAVRDCIEQRAKEELERFDELRGNFGLDVELF